MLIKGLKIKDSVRYVKFHRSSDNSITENESLSSMDIYCMNTSDLGATKGFPIETTDHEYTKLSRVNYSLTLPGFSLTKMSHEPLIVSIIVVKIDHDNQQDGADSNTIFFDYDRLTILLREDKRTVADLAELMSQLTEVGFSVEDPEALVGNLTTTIIRDKDISTDYINDHSIDFNNQVSVLDWSHALDGLLTKIHEDLKLYGFNKPTTKIAQELTTEKNLIRYEFNNLEQSNRGHLVGSHWMHFFMHKMPFEIELVISETSTYVRLLHEIQMFNRITNIGSFDIIDNEGDSWNVAVEWSFPVENSFEVSEPKGSSDTVGNTIRLNGFIHFFTVAKNKFMEVIKEVLTNIADEVDSKVIN